MKGLGSVLRAVQPLQAPLKQVPRPLHNPLEEVLGQATLHDGDA